MAKNDERLQFVKLDAIKESPVALRKVNKSKSTYLGLVDSIRQQGVLNPIVICESKDPDTGKTVFALVDGLHRFTAALDAGLKEIPCHIVPLADTGILIAQMIANAQKVETTPKQYAENLTHWFMADPTLTVQEASAKLGMSIGWIGQMLKLVNITDAGLSEAVNKGEIPVAKAQALAELPEEEQTQWTERAMTMPTVQFRETVKARVKEIQDAKRKGRPVKPDGF